jgi:hypothetical protein
MARKICINNSEEPVAPIFRLGCRTLQYLFQACKNPVILSVIQYCQKPLDSTSEITFLYIPTIGEMMILH